MVTASPGQNRTYATAEEVSQVAERMLEQVPAADYRHLAEMLVEHDVKPDYDHAAEFEFGLVLILDGLERLIGPTASRLG